MKKTKQIYKTYLYLGRRDKQGAKLVARFQSEAEVVSRITNVKLLNLPITWEKKIEQIAYKNRMNWELWIETVPTYEELKKRLRKRGYTDISMNPVPMLNEFQPNTLNDKSLQKPKKTMLGRGKK